jgi:hypothetical protein
MHTPDTPIFGNGFELDRLEAVWNRSYEPWSFDIEIAAIHRTTGGVRHVLFVRASECSLEAFGLYSIGLSSLYKQGYPGNYEIFDCESELVILRCRDVIDITEERRMSSLR